MTSTTLRNTDLGTLATMLQTQHETKHDVVVPLAQVRMNDDGTIAVPNVEPVISPEGDLSEQVTYSSAVLSANATGNLADKADIPVKYLKRMLAEDAPLAATNVNRWLGVDARTALLRTFSHPDGGTGFLRAILSDSFCPIDNLDGVLATLSGFRKAGVEAKVTAADLTDTSMVVRFSVPQINLNVADLVEHYEFKGARGIDNPIMELGWVLKNSETGGGAFTLSPSATILVCKNGMTRKQDAYRRIHTGSKLDAGVIRWSEETASKELELITLKTADVIKTYSTAGYLEAIADEARTFAGIALPGAKTDTVIKVVAKSLSFTEAETDALLAAFIDGRDHTIFGVGQAVTGMAQDLDADRQVELEESVWETMALAARTVR